VLQIASGKLFALDAGRRNELRGVIYSNLRIYRSDVIETAVGRILPLDVASLPNAFAFEFIEQIEGRADGPGVLISRTAAPYVSEFAVVMAFALNVMCSPDANLVERLTSGKRGLGIHDPPSSYIPRVFDNDVWLQEAEIEPLMTFVSDLLALERRSYRAAIRAMTTYVTGLHRMGDDLALAYTLLVASIESLAQGFDGHRADWPDFEQAKRERIDVALKAATPEVARDVRGALLEIEHVSLKRRFRDFTLNHLNPHFFREEAAAVAGPVGRRELSTALTQAYQVRSRYIHNLAQLPRVLAMGAMPGDITTIDRLPHLTFRGLARVARHVIFEFVARQPRTEKEVYDYHLESPGVVSLPMAPQYWIWQTEGFKPESGRRRFEATLEQLAGALRREPDSGVTDIRAVLGHVEPQLAQMRVVDRRPFVALHLVFNAYAPAAFRMASADAIEAKYAGEFNDPSGESLILNLLFDQTPAWPLEQHAEALSEHFRTRSHKDGYRLPAIFEAGLMLALAERYRLDRQGDEARRIVSAALEDHPSLRALAEFEASFSTEAAIDWRKILLPDEADAEPQTTAEPEVSAKRSGRSRPTATPDPRAL
jgi:hypothetical protein